MPFAFDCLSHHLSSCSVLILSVCNCSATVVATAAAGSSAGFASNAVVWRPETASGKAVRTVLTNQAGALRESYADSHTTVFQ